MKRPGRLKNVDELVELFRDDPQATARIPKHKLAISKELAIYDGAGNCRGVFYEDQLTYLLRRRRELPPSALTPRSQVETLLIEIRDLLKTWLNLTENLKK